jgi:hypothetical protein
MLVLLHYFCRRESVPVLKNNAMRKFGENKIEAPLIISVLDEESCAVSRFGRFTFRENDSGVHWIRSSVGNRVVEMRIILVPNPNRTASVQDLASNFRD